MPFYLLQKIADCPDEDSRIPETALRAHLLRACPVRFLDEALDRRSILFVRSGRLDVAVALFSARWDDADRHKRVGLLRDLFGLEESSPELGVVADEPVGVNRNHRRVLAVSMLDTKRGPR